MKDGDRFYAVTIEAWGTPPASDDASSDLLDALAKLGAEGPAVTIGGLAGGAGCTISVRAPSMEAAGDRAAQLFRAACKEASITIEGIALLEVMDEEYQERWLEEPGIELAGVSEIAELLGVSRQRIRELRTQEGFPAPLAELKSGPVWSLASLDLFRRSWSRKPGRPRSYAELGEIERMVLQTIARLTASYRREAVNSGDILGILKNTVDVDERLQALKPNELLGCLQRLVNEDLLETVPSESRAKAMGRYQLTPEGWRLYDSLRPEWDTRPNRTVWRKTPRVETEWTKTRG